MKKIDNLTSHARAVPYTGTLIDVSRGRFAATDAAMTVAFEGDAPSLPVEDARRLTGRVIPSGSHIGIERRDVAPTGPAPKDGAS